MSESSTEQPTGPVADVQDFFGSGGGGYPVITFGDAPKGAKVTGVVLPVSASEPDKGYKTTVQTNIKGETQYWPKRNPSDPNEALRPRPQAEVNLATEFRQNEFMSDNATARRKEQDQDDDGLRRWIVKGGSATKALKEALTKAGVNGPLEVGATVTVTMANKEANDHGGKSYVFTVDYKRPTAETRALVEKHLASLGSAEETDGPEAEEPPF